MRTVFALLQLANGAPAHADTAAESRFRVEIIFYLITPTIRICISGFRTRDSHFGWTPIRFAR